MWIFIFINYSLSQLKLQILATDTGDLSLIIGNCITIGTGSNDYHFESQLIAFSWNSLTTSSVLLMKVRINYLKKVKILFLQDIMK